MDEWEKELSDGFDSEVELSEGQQRSLAIEQEEALTIELERDERRSLEKPVPPAKRKLKRELEQEALARLESAARTVSDWNDVIAWWDKLDANRERRERYHEISRSGDDLPIDYGAVEDGPRFPDRMNSILERQRQKGDFIDTIFNCPYDIQELVTEEYMSKVLLELSEDHKEILYFSAIRAYSTKLIGVLRGQTDRNIRKVKNTLMKKIRKKILPELKRRKDLGLPMTKDEREFLAEMEAGS